MNRCSPLVVWFRWFLAGWAIYAALIALMYLTHLNGFLKGWPGFLVVVGSGAAIIVVAEFAEARARHRQKPSQS